jgi:hypothetical protein
MRSDLSLGGGHMSLFKSAERMQRSIGAPARRLFALWLIGVFLAAQACALPMHLGFAFLRGDEKEVTQGCDQKTCCTALCFVDKHGVHHCVHKPGDSCKCRASTNELDQDPTLLVIVANLPKIEKFVPNLVQAGWILQKKELIAAFDSPTPTPPPK